jgi:WhiB family redox-sensing transcriptional regulator
MKGTTFYDFALCKDRDPLIFFPESGPGVIAAKKICAQCPVKVACLNYALDNEIEHGIWGGTGQRERMRIKRANKKVVSA